MMKLTPHLKYLLGFIISIILTLLAYGLVDAHLASKHMWPPDNILVGALIAIAVAQLFAQLILFLHIGEESRPRWKLMVAAFAGIVVLIVVVGSIWIMNNLMYHMNVPASVETDIMIDEGIQREDAKPDQGSHHEKSPHSDDH